MLLNNLRLTDTGPAQSLLIEKGYIKHIAPEGYRPDTSFTLNFDDAMAFPGLINSHDHLEFNSFPLLGNYHYPNYVDWGIDIHTHNKGEIEPVLSIPKALRIKWGVYKNLLNGITTVINHGPELPVPDDLISVFQQCYSLHSIRLEKNWKLKLNYPGHASRPFVIHIGEGTDTLSQQEINELIRWNVFSRPLIGVHGVAMSARQAARFLALVWCPDSNLFLLGKTAAVRELRKHTQIVFGTDSTLTGSWNLWEQLRLAQATGLATDQELFDMVTLTPAGVWNFPDRGKLAVGSRADMVVAKKKAGSTLMESFYQLNPEDMLLVMHRGEIKLFDASLYPQFQDQNRLPADFSTISIRGQQKQVKGNLPALMQDMARYHPEIIFPINYEL